MTLEMSIGIDARSIVRDRPSRWCRGAEGAGERGICAGGDIRGLYESSRAGGDLGRAVSGAKSTS